MENRLKILRIKNNISVENISKLLEISEKQYLEYEAVDKNLPLPLLIKVSKIYNTSIDFLVGDTNDINRNVKK